MIDLNKVIVEAQDMARRAERAGMYPGRDLRIIARLIEDLARAIKERT
jgi:hypothetical protein